MSFSVVAIGVFDGVHLGHQALISRAVEVAADRPVIALTFDPHPMTVVRGMTIHQLCSLKKREELLIAAGASSVYVCQFDHGRAQQSAEDFISSVLRDKLHTETVVVGTGFRFGHGAQGSAQTLRAAGFTVVEVEHVAVAGSRVSSTRIREAVAACDLDVVKTMLGRTYSTSGIVVHGLARGRELGFPTANLKCDYAVALPSDGVYAGWLKDGSDTWPAAISVGTNPTFDDVFERIVEAHVIGIDTLDLYSHEIELQWVQRVRPMQAFDSVSDLVSAMTRDVAQISDILGESGNAVR